MYIDQPWETPGTIAHSWGYNALENQWKSTSQLLESLIDNVSLNGGYTLNIGPRADGSVPYEGVSRLEDIGAWMAKSGESVYGSTGLGLRNGQYDWGRITTKSAGNKQDVYLQVYNWPLDHILRVTGILLKPQSMVLITPSGKKILSFTQLGPLMHIQLPDQPGDHFVSTIVLHYEQPVDLDRQVTAESTFGGFALSGQNTADHSAVFQLVNYDGLRPTHLVIDHSGSLAWRLYIPEAGSYKVNLSFHNASGTDMAVDVSAAGQVIHRQLKPTGKVVVEPHDGYTEEFADNRIGIFNFPKAGFYEVTLKANPAAGEKLLFNRIWVDKEK